MTTAESRSRSRHRFSADSVGAYLHEIGRVPLLTQTDEIELAQRVEVGLLAAERLSRLRPGASDEGAADLGDELRWLAADGGRAMKHLICANLRLVVSVARHFTGRGLDLLDLIQEGNLGLIRAAPRFDHTRGFKFSTYATWWIRQSIQRALADQARTIRLPAYQVEALTALNQVQHRLRQRFGRDGTIAELGQASGLTTQQILTLRNRTGQPRSIDAPVWADLGSGLENVPFGDTISDATALDPCDAAGRTLLLERLACHLALLPDREASVLSMRYGLGSDIARPRREIGAQLGVSYDRVRQIELQALARLRPPLASGRVPARVSARAETTERGVGRFAAASVSRSA
ncbi:sigma-70 family RNA polymerase sigma factor [Cryobacterium sp. TMT2-15-1]|uniref:sigma-70 family RNA polymerase sigma factor n=1 Tax=Cryobacterium sp. TMT2-15-1 TaxID=1259246 RepID=UPI00106CAA81|nr:sigma-70 family RNA polymerase sigma factor [Cryobacterium sp. TMT2-15-1]TFC59546.1 sigma-70 family RNA polymerase sigma factor [Cryobacterium sp. TMT2-15-1]